MGDILVVGGCGQIGSHVVDVLLERKNRVIVLDPRPPLREWARYIQRDKLIYRHGSSADIRQINAIASEYDVVEIYDFGGWLGSEELSSLFDTAVMYNLTGARNVYELAKMKDARVYHTSIEFAGYGFTDGYSVTKEMALRIAKEYAKKWNVFIVSSYVHHVFCERQRILPTRKIIPTLISYAVAGRTFRIFGSPDKMMDLLYARDFAEVVVDLLRHEEVERVDRHVYDIGVGYGIRLEDLVKMVYNEVGREPMYVVTEDVRKQSSDPYRIATNDWMNILGERKLRGVKEMLDYVVEKYLETYNSEDFMLAVEVYEQRHRFKEVGV